MIQTTRIAVFLALSLLLASGCKKVVQTPNAPADPNAADDRLTKIWIGKGDTLYTLTDARAEGQSYTSANPMHVEHRYFVNGPAEHTAMLITGNSPDKLIFPLAGGSLQAFNAVHPDQIPLWSLNANADLNHAIGLSNGSRILLGTQQGRLIAMLSNGSITSELDLPGTPAITGSAAWKSGVEEGKVAVAGDNGSVYFLDTGINADSLSIDTFFVTGGGISGGILTYYHDAGSSDITDVIVGSDDGNLYSLSTRYLKAGNNFPTQDTLVLNWQYNTGGPIRCSPEINHWADPTYPYGVIQDPLIYFGSDDGKVSAVDAIDGQLRWQYQTNGPVRSSPYFQNRGALLDDRGVVYVGSDGGGVYAFESHTGAFLWWNDLNDGPVSSSPVCVDNTPPSADGTVSRYTVYISTASAVWGLDGDNGEVRSKIQLPGNATSSPVARVRYEGVTGDSTVYWQVPRHPSVVGGF